MFNLFKALINNMNQVHYRKTINKIKLKKSDNANNEKNNLVDDKKYSLDEIIRLETTVREKNLSVYLNTAFWLHRSRFLIITLPAMLSAATIAVTALPNRTDKVKEIDVIEEEHTLYESDLGKTEYIEKYRLLTGDETMTFSKYSDKNPEHLEEISSIPDGKVTFKMYDDIDSILAKFFVTDDGKLFLEDIDLGNIVDFNEYDNLDFSDIDQSYDVLVTQVINMLKTSDLIRDDYKEILNKLTESDKKKIVLEVIKYGDAYKQEAIIAQSRIGLKIVMIAISVIYMFIEFCGLSDSEKYSLLKAKGKKLKFEDGELGYDNKEIDYSLIFGPLSAKEDFLEAERERILKLQKELYDNTRYPGEYSPLLTDYEKKIK